MKKSFWGLLLWVFLMGMPRLVSAQVPLPADTAFQFSADFTNPNTVMVSWKIAPHYHLYRDRMSVTTSSTDPVKLGVMTLPKGHPEHDDILGHYETFRDTVSVSIPLLSHPDKPFDLLVHYQGCADSGFCYPPTTKRLAIDPANSHQIVITNEGHIRGDAAASSLAKNEQDRVTQLLTDQNFFVILASFFGFGVLLAFTPCVFPMVPILAGIIVGHGQSLGTRKAFFLSLTYVLGMAFTYAVAGILAGLLGGSLQSAFQSPWILGSFSLLFVLLAFSLLGHYELQLPARLQNKLLTLSHHQKGGSYFSVAVMGCLASLIVSPCVSAPLVGALSYIGKTGNAVLGGSALFSLGLGSGLPLLILGTSGGKWLPKAGAWMEDIKKIFGILLLGVAIVLLDRIVSPGVTMVLWGGLCLLSAVYLGLFLSSIGYLRRTLSSICAVYGLVILVGGMLGNTEPLLPLKSLLTPAEPSTSLVFTPVKSLQELQRALSLAHRDGKSVMLDFSADWCVACKQMERTTFADQCVKKTLGQTVLLQVDVTQNNSADRALQRFYQVIAPPTILFFDRAGHEQRAQRIVGERSPKEFLQDMRLTPVC